MTARVLVVRTDSDGDVLLAGPAVRAVARHAAVTLLVSPAGEQAARLLPGPDDVLVTPAPWSGYEPPPVDAATTAELVGQVRARRPDAALVLTSFHQSPLPVALLLRLAGVPWIGAASTDYPGSLLDLRLPAPADPDLRSGPDHAPDLRHEVERSLDLARAAGYPPAPDDDGRLAVRRPLPGVRHLLPPRAGGTGTGDHATGPGHVVLHPGASVPARAPDPDRAAAIAAAIAAAGRTVVLTGGPAERALTARVAAAVPARLRHAVHDLGGRTTLPELAVVLDAAACAVVGNTGPAHLAAAVGTPVVSLFAPVVPAAWWRPWGVPCAVLGDQHAGCRGTRARRCPVAGHPCLNGVDPTDVVAAVETLAREAVPA